MLERAQRPNPARGLRISLPSVMLLVEELYKQADRYLMPEDNILAATQTVMITNQLAEGNKSSKKKPSEFNEGQSRDRKQYRDQSHKKREFL